VNWTLIICTALVCFSVVMVVAMVTGKQTPKQQPKTEHTKIKKSDSSLN